MKQSPLNRLRVDGQLLTPVIAMVRRELLSTLRNRRYYYLMGFSLLALLGGLVLYFYNNQNIDMRRPFSMTQMSTVFFLLYAYTLYIIASLLVPTVASNTICAEKQQDQLDLVRMSYITPTTYLLGKAVNILSLYFLLVVATLPFAGVLFYFTGVDWMQYGQMLSFIFGAACSGTMIGLLCSTWCHRTVPAAICTFFLVLLSQLGLGLIGIVALAISYQFGWLEVKEWHFAVPWSMIPARNIGLLSMSSVGPLSLLFGLGYQTALCLTCALLAHRTLNRPTAPMKVNQEKTIDDPTLLEQRRKRFPYYLIDPQRRRPLIGDDQNPILAKERCTSFTNRKTTSIRILYAMAILSVVAGAFGSAMAINLWGTRDTVLVYFLVDTAILLCIVPTYIATAFSKEHEWGNWDMLRMTLLRPAEVVWGKFAAALLGLALPAGALLLGIFPFVESFWRESRVLEGFLLGLATMGSAILYLLALGTALAVRHTRSLPAMITTYVAGFIALFGIPFAIFFGDDVLRPRTEIFESSYWLSPFTTLLLRFTEKVPVRLDQIAVQTAIFLFLSGILLMTAMIRYDTIWYASATHGPPTDSSSKGLGDAS